MLKCFFEGLDEGVAQGLWLSKANFFFGGMDVYIDGFGRKGDEEKERGKTSATDKRMIDFINSVIDDRGGGGATVYKDKLIGAIFASRLG